MADIRLIVADLDGTLLGHRSERQDYEALLTKLDQITDAGTLWVVNTGRSISSFRRVFGPLIELGVVPNHVIVEHAYVFSVTKWGYLPHFIWNTRTYFTVMLAKFRTLMMIRRLTKVIKTKFRRVRCRHLGRYRMAYRFIDDASVKKAYKLLRELASPNRNIFVSEHIREILVSAVPFTKGLAVDHLANHLGIRRENILCIGDGQNDISMLDGTSASMTACPSNATVEVMRTVQKSGGHISRKPALAGTIESIEAHETGTVNSNLPDDIVFQEECARAMIPSDHSGDRHSNTSLVNNTILVILCLAAVLLTLASCRMLGPLSTYLMVPIEKAAESVANLVEMLF